MVEKLPEVMKSAHTQMQKPADLPECVHTVAAPSRLATGRVVKTRAFVVTESRRRGVEDRSPATTSPEDSTQDVFQD